MIEFQQQILVEKYLKILEERKKYEKGHVLQMLFSVINPVKIIWFYEKLEIRSVERGICPIATSTMNELFL